ncbi:MAG: hypothetical protein HC865_27035 [Cyanobacteria bacterium RU_5_0]|nr:hypothetical protein [Cyanobacteria bacterium RU_5_0]
MDRFDRFLSQMLPSPFYEVLIDIPSIVSSLERQNARSLTERSNLCVRSTTPFPKQTCRTERATRSPLYSCSQLS